jgi:2-beta-glucuronyltransferase
MQNAPRRVILVSPAYVRSKRRAGFHHLAFAFWNVGWDVTCVTAPISFLRRLRGDYRFEYPVLAEANRLVPVRERLTSFVLMTSWQPGTLRSPLANRLATPLFRRYAQIPLGPLERLLPEADLVVFDTTAALLLVPRFRALAPRSRLVYRPSDDLRRLRIHPILLDAEAEAIPQFDLVSVPTRDIAAALEPYGPVHVHPPAIDKSAFDRSTDSPYDSRPAAVFAGVTHRFDYDTLAMAACLAPNVAFHIVGIPPRPLGANVAFHPEVPFDEVVPYLQHATFGLLFFPPGYPSLGQGNKVAQYSYCRLPIVAPSFFETDRRNMCLFEHGDSESLRGALDEAEQMPHSAAFAEGVLSAEELASLLTGDDQIEADA